MKALEDPDSELAQQLLASEELERERVNPWWETPTASGSEDPSGEETERKEGAPPPPIIPIPAPLVKQSANNALSGPLLLYNICAVW